MGIFRYVRHFSPVRKRGPNVKFVVNPGKGANDGLVSLIAWSQNGSGISPNSAWLDLGFFLGGSQRDLNAWTAHAPADHARLFEVLGGEARSDRC